MKLQLRKLQQALNPAYRKQTVKREEMEAFKQQLRGLLAHLNPDESEENAKGHLTTFLKGAFYADAYLVATKERADLVIHNGPRADAPVAVLLETKRPRAQGQPAAADMVRSDRPNVKAMHELLLYFLRERIEEHNTDLKYLIITDVHEFFVFDAADFERLFLKNRALLKDYKDWRDGRKTSATTEFFYQHIAQPMLEGLDEELPCVHFDLRHYAAYAQNDDPTDDYRLIPLFKLLAPTHLLRLPYTNDSNSLNKDFYYELLHLIGLEETKEANKKVIRRKPEGQRDAGSLLENAIRTIQTEERLERISDRSRYGHTTEEQLFGAALELSITWVNRILFLKLLEAQLLQYHHGDAAYRFLHSGLLRDYDEVNELFFEVLAKRPADRSDYTRARFGRVPYLNSSLFEITPLEAETIRINSMKDRFELPLYGRSVLKDDKGRRRTGSLPVLEYLFAFLDAYNFSSEGSEHIQEDNKTLINASVLGLIFEKINGYQDGAFFTPGFITMYMCQQTLRRATVQKFRESTYFADFDSDAFGDLRNYLSRKYSTPDLAAANALVNGLRICDPAVGSGHFLVSALNELLAIKSELGILSDRQGKPLPVRVEVANDELSAQWARTDELFAYRPGVQESQTVQEALFHEKQTLIEGCLFGVDLNPNSVKICRLRLWIELLKNAYYKAPDELETLPNIDINIKQGNSLVNRFALDADLRPVLRQNKWNITDYRLAVASYHSARSKDDKRQLMEHINRIKSDFQTHITSNDPRIKALSKLRGQKFVLENKAEIGNLFEKLKEEDVAQDLQKLDAQIAKAEAEVEEIRSAVIYRDAFEWRFEFPEVLNEEGEFVGFDAILGNPPYFSLSKIKEQSNYFANAGYETYSKGADIYCLFYERGGQLLKPNGFLNYITSNSWLRAIYGEPLKQLFVTKLRPLSLLNIQDIQVFEEATVESNVILLQKAALDQAFPVASITKEYSLGDSLLDYFDNHKFSFYPTTSNEWFIGDQSVSNLKSKIERGSKLLKEFQVRINFGIKTGYNEAFIIDSDKKQELIKRDPQSELLIKPILRGRDLKKYSHEFANIFVICTFPSLGLNIDDYPSIKNHFLAIGQNRLAQSGEPGSRKKTNNKWFETQDSIGYWKDFEVPKIIWGEISDKPKFAYDDSGYYAEATTFLMTGERLKFLLAILNSRVSEWYFNLIGTTTGMGTNRWKKYKIELLPIKEPDEKTEHHITDIVDKIIQAKQSSPTADTSALEAEIDALVYALYELTEAEIALVSGGA